MIQILECVQSGLDGTLENSADSCGNTFFLTACYYRLSTKWKWKKYEWVGVRGIIVCPSNFPKCLACHLLQSSGFCSLWFLIVSGVNLYIFPYVKS